MDPVEVVSKYQQYKYRSRFLKLGDHADQFLELAQAGVFVGFADSFQYKDGGYVLVGDHEVGKSRTNGKFVSWYNRYSRRLSMDDTLFCYDGNQLLVHETPLGLIDFSPVIERREGIPVKSFFYLTHHRIPVEVELDLVLERMFRFPSDPKWEDVDPRIKEACYGAFSDIPLIQLPHEETLDIRTRNLKRIIDDELGVRDSQ